MGRRRDGLPERRHGEDSWLKILRWMGLVGWLAMFAGAVLFAQALPEMKTFFERHYHLTVRAYWDESRLFMFTWMMTVGAILSVAGLTINLLRYNRREDEIRVSMVLLCIISISGLIFVLMK